MRFFATVKMLLALHCDESARLMSEGLERELSATERWAVRLHLISCRFCRRFRRQLAWLQQIARQRAKLGAEATAGLQHLSEEAREKIIARIRGTDLS